MNSTIWSTSDLFIYYDLENIEVRVISLDKEKEKNAKIKIKHSTDGFFTKDNLSETDFFIIKTRYIDEVMTMGFGYAGYHFMELYRQNSTSSWVKVVEIDLG